MKNVIIILAIAACIMIVAAPAQAEKQWYSATVNYAGVDAADANITYINATSTNESWEGMKWFIITGSEAHAALAIALSAVSLSSPVIIMLDNTDLDDWSPCYGIVITPQ
jgi:hypothetical protein